MGNGPDTEFARELLDRARGGEGIGFRFLHSLSELSEAKAMARATKKVAEAFGRSAAGLLRRYVGSLEAGRPTLELLLAHMEMSACEGFYEAEARTLRDMADEYRCYLRWGHRLQALMGVERPEADEVDWRTLPIR